MSSVRYVPRIKRKRSLDQQQPPPQQQPQPAFTSTAMGGFSSLQYNDDDDDGDDGSGDNETGQLVASAPKEQRPEDFMDDQDHNEWGGPVRVKQHFGGGGGSSTMKQSAIIESSIVDSIFGHDDKKNHHDDDDVNKKDVNIGSRLLHRLGWRGQQGVSFVPQDDEHTAHSHSVARNNNDNDNENPLERVFLSSRRLRKIRVQQERVRIPPPKTDHAGLGFQTLENAPEFRAHREQRQRLAQARQQQQQQQQGSSGSNNVYRLSNLLVDKNKNNHPKPPPPRAAASAASNGNNHDASSLSYETIQDFVGTKSVGGFALRDDDDDAVFDDPAPTRGQQGGEDDAYETVAYEHTLSDVEDEEDDNHGNLDRTREAQALGGALAAFANLDDDTKEQGEKEHVNHHRHPSSSAIGHVGEQKSHASLLRTADGRVPLPGFVLGTHEKQQHHQLHFYRGPDVPELYQVTPHEFPPNDHPQVYQALSRAMQLEAKDARQAAATKASLQSNAAAVQKKTSNSTSSTTAATKTPPATQPMAGAAFAGLQEAMKNRFVSSSSSLPKVNNDHIGTTTMSTATAGDSFSGLVTHAALISVKNPEQQQQVALSNSVAAAAEPAKKLVVVKRTIMSFTPEPLVCKRFHVAAPPQSALERQQQKHRHQQGVEDAYFHDSILKAAQEQRQVVVAANGQVLSGTRENEDEDERVIHEPERPSMQIYKSIFAPESESSESEDDVDPVKPDSKVDEKNDDTQPVAASVREKNVLNDPSFGIDDNKDEKDSRALVVASHGESSPRRKRTWSSDSSNLSSSSDDSDKSSDGGDEKRRRRDKKSSHRKHHHHHKSHHEKKKKKHSRKRKTTDDRRHSQKKRHNSEDNDESFYSNDKEDSDDHRRRRKDSKKSRRKEGKSKRSRCESSSHSERRHRT